MPASCNRSLGQRTTMLARANHAAAAAWCSISLPNSAPIRPQYLRFQVSSLLSCPHLTDTAPQLCHAGAVRPVCRPDHGLPLAAPDGLGQLHRWYLWFLCHVPGAPSLGRRQSLLLPRLLHGENIPIPHIRMFLLRPSCLPLLVFRAPYILQNSLPPTHPPSLRCPILGSRCVPSLCQRNAFAYARVLVLMPSNLIFSVRGFAGTGRYVLRQPILRRKDPAEDRRCRGCH